MNLTDAYDDNNVFAKILRGEMPSVKLYEDEKTYAFMDVMPQVPGHVLIIPKSPATNLLTLDADDAAAMMRTTQKMGKAVQQATDAPGFMVMQLNGAKAGQTVFHIHMHVIPRHDGLEMSMHAREMADMADLEAMAVKIRAAL